MSSEIGRIDKSAASTGSHQPRWQRNGGTFCIICHNLNIHSQGRHERLRIDFFQLAESAELEDCLYCVVIYQSMLHHEAQISLDGYSLVDIYAKLNRPWHISWDDKVQGRTFLEVFCAEGQQSDIPDLGTAQEIFQEPQDPQLISRIKYWISHCEENHRSCQTMLTSNPKRLLDIGLDASTSIRLIESETCLSQPVKYVALSHCWGKGKSCTTENGNLDKRLERIEWNELPKTFQDTIFVARFLEIQYIWIDSLCILQDNRNDWEVESTKMGAIYQDAFITVAAGCSSAAEDGFLFPRTHWERYKPIPISVEFRGKPIKGVRAKAPHDHRIIKEVDPLVTRGWTLQERLLSRRFLNYSSSAVTFECIQGGNCECGDGLFPVPMAALVPKPPLMDRTQYFRIIGGSQISQQVSSDEISHFWSRQIIENYTSRALTKASDRLPAISALATVFQDLLGDQYVAGLWRSTLLYGLQWMPAASSPKSNAVFPILSPLNTLPSWSWASIEGPVRFRDLNTNPRAIISGVEVTLKGQSTFGEVESGWIKVYAECKTALISLSSVVEHELQCNVDKYFIPIDGNTIQFSEGSLFFDTIVDEMEAFSEDGKSFTTIARSHSQPYQTHDSVFGEVLCLLILGSEFSEMRMFLVLGGHPSILGAYKRIGILKVFSYSSLDEHFNDLAWKEVQIY